MPRNDRLSWVDSVRLPTAVSDIAICLTFYAICRLDRGSIPAVLPIVGTWIGYRFGSRNTKRVMEAQERGATAAVRSMRPPAMPTRSDEPTSDGGGGGYSDE